MSVSQSFCTFLILLVPVFVFGQEGSAMQILPNFIVINIDDLGYGDIGPFGSTINRTPNLQRMATEGRRLTSFYAAPVCSPSRASLLTGCYPKRALPIPHVLFPENNIGLSPNEVTIAEVLKEAGYATAIIGKWHLGDQPDFLPNNHGFDYHFGLPYSNDMGPPSDGTRTSLGQPLPEPNEGAKEQPPLPLMRNRKVIKRVVGNDQQDLVESYTRESVEYIEDHKTEPFFLYVAHSAVHFPIYPGKNFAGKSPHGIYSDWVEEVDWSVGEILNAVCKSGISDRTLVIFTSDNGGTQRGSNAPLRGFKNSTWEGGIRVPTIAWWPGKIPNASESDSICGMMDVLPTLAEFAGTRVPDDRTIDGVSMMPLLTETGTEQIHETFFYYRGLNLEAVRHGDWKLHVPQPKAKETTSQLFNLATDIGESSDVSAANPDVVQELLAIIESAESDLGVTGLGPGCRELGRVENAGPLIDREGNIRQGLEPDGNY